MKATLEFDLPDDRTDLDLALAAGHMYSILCDVDNMLRNGVKHGDPATYVDTMIVCRERLSEFVTRFQ